MKYSAAKSGITVSMKFVFMNSLILQTHSLLLFSLDDGNKQRVELHFFPSRFLFSLSQDNPSLYCP